MEKWIDLHTHTACSDGTFTPEQLVMYALEKGLSAIAVTDHDTVDGIERALKVSEHTGLEVIPGIELSSAYGSRDIHIVGLGIDHKNHLLLEHLDDFYEKRLQRNIRMIHNLQLAGIPIDEADFFETYKGSVITRGHFAAYMYAKGFIRNRKEAFIRYIGDHGPCYVDRPRITPGDAIRLIRNCGGHPILAHPLLYKMSKRALEDFVMGLGKYGLQGLEAIYSTNTGTDESSMKQLAKKCNLAISGGSDFHGANKPDIDLGCGRGKLRVPAELWDIIKALPV